MADVTTNTYDEFIGVTRGMVVPRVTGVEDIIDYLTWGNVRSSLDNDWVDNNISFGNEMTERDSKGAWLGANYNANVIDAVSDAAKYKLPYMPGLNYTVPKDLMAKFGIKSPTDFQRPAGTINIDGLLSSERMVWVVDDMVRKMRSYAREQTRSFLINMGTVSAKDYQKPFGLPLVGDAADRINHWNYDNLGSAALSRTDNAPYVACTNTLQSKQKNFANQDFGASKLMILIDAQDADLAAQVFTGQLVRDINVRQAGDEVIPALNNFKMTGSYEDPVNTSDWIGIGQNHKIMRVYVDNGLVDNRGFEFQMEYTVLEGYTLWGFLSGDIVCLDPNDLYKAKVTI